MWTHAAVLVLSLIASPAGAQARVIDTVQSTITVRVFKSGLFKTFGDDHVIRAPIAEGTVDDSSAPGVRLEVDVRRMEVRDPGISAKDREEVQTRMLGPDVLDAGRFARVAFRSTTVEASGPDGWQVRGDLELHGRVRPITMRVVREGGRYKGSAKLRQSDFGITPISIAGGVVKVKDEVTIDFEIVTSERPGRAESTRGNDR
jgi:polyisoprenoid-binding protein YceI